VRSGPPVRASPCDLRPTYRKDLHTKTPGLLLTSRRGSVTALRALHVLRDGALARHRLRADAGAGGGPRGDGRGGERLHVLQHAAEPDLRAVHGRSALLHLHPDPRGTPDPARRRRRETPDQRPAHDHRPRPRGGVGPRHPVRRSPGRPDHGLRTDGEFLRRRSATRHGTIRPPVPHLRLQDPVLRPRRPRYGRPELPPPVLPPDRSPGPEQPDSHRSLRPLRLPRPREPPDRDLRPRRRHDPRRSRDVPRPLPLRVASRLQAARCSRASRAGVRGAPRGADAPVRGLVGGGAGGRQPRGI
jgi:hypothetical protein